MENEIINKVALSGIITIDLEEFYPQGERVVFDIKDLLFQGLILREKDFREFVKNEDWSKYTDKYLALICSADAVVPTWAYMLLVIQLEPYTKKVVFGNLETLETVLYHEILNYQTQLFLCMALTVLLIAYMPRLEQQHLLNK